jgi:Tol biopolymer transport system component
MIAFESERDDPAGGEHLDIFTMNADGTGLSRVTDTDAWYAQPDWSADGSRIVVSFAESQDAGEANLGVLDLNTRELTRLTEGPGIKMEPSWSADGTQIAFTSDRDGALNIYTINLDTGEETQLTQASGDNNHPDWSKDGKKILFVSTRDGDEEIYVMDADGGNQARLTTTPGRDVDPEWSPDGNFFAYGHEESGLRKIYVSDLKGSPPELLFDMPEQTTAGHPSWSPPEVTLSDDPVMGPPFCARDSDGNFEPDTPSPVFTSEDQVAYIVFPFDNMQDGMDFWYILNQEGDFSFSSDNHPGWDGGEQGIHTIFTMTPIANGTKKVLVELYLGEKLMQEIECEVV